jgi:hypothetical protein
MWPLFVLVVIVVMSRIPQLYGKNYTSYPASFFHSTKDNLHSINMNTIWTGKTEDYPVRKKQVEIIEGNGIISNTILKNTQRQFLVQATTPLRIVDYTFYFPGWEVEIDGKQVPIEFQDEHFRGVITYRIPVGEHKVDMIFADTRVRKVAKLISVVSIVFLLVLFILRKKVLSKLGHYAKYY